MGDRLPRATGSRRDQTSSVRWCAAAGAIAGLLAAGCGTRTADPPAPSAAKPAVADASRVDMCTILRDSELTALGVRLDSRRAFNTKGVVGCRWLGKPYTLSMARDNSKLAGYQAQRTRPEFVDFTDNTVKRTARSPFCDQPQRFAVRPADRRRFGVAVRQRGGARQPETRSDRTLR